MMKSVLPFTFALSGASRPSRFIAIQTAAPDGEQFLSVTPNVTLWTDHIYLLDLSPVLEYWKRVAEQNNQTFNDYITSLLRVLTSETPAHITMAGHPWQALLLLSVTAERPELRFVDGKSHLGQRLRQDVTWQHWIERCRELREHLMERVKGKDKNRLWTLSTLTKTIERMRFTHITQMSDIDAPAMRRRFGNLVAQAWEWTWEHPQINEPTQSHNAGLIKDDNSNNESRDSLYRDGFPWKNIRPTELPQIHRHIETTLRQWDHIEPILREDFDNICNLTCWSSHERVVSLEWVLSFSCNPPLRIPVLFRHPHALHRDSGHHKTALLQAFHSWQNATNSRRQPELSGDTYISDDSITGWTLTVTERLVIAPQFRGIFRDDLSGDALSLRNLENSLPVPLIAYAMTEHWAPEKSFTPMITGSAQEEPRDKTMTIATANIKPIPFGNIAKLATNQRRPLFIYDQPIPLSDQHQSSGLIFCERVGTAWWDDLPTPRDSHCRDYYIRITNNGLLQWVYQDSCPHPDRTESGDKDQKALWLHGIFG